MRGEYDTMTEECSQAIVDAITSAWPLVFIPRAGHCKTIDEPHECIREITRFLNTVEGIRNGYKVSEALVSTRSRSFDDSMGSPGKIFRRLKAILPPTSEDDANEGDLPPVVILPQAVLPDVIIVPPGDDQTTSVEGK